MTKRNIKNFIIIIIILSLLAVVLYLFNVTKEIMGIVDKKIQTITASFEIEENKINNDYEKYSIDDKILNTWIFEDNEDLDESLTIKRNIFLKK